MEEPNLIGDKRNADGTFTVGNPGGPGRPKGSISIIGKIKQKFEEDPVYFEEWVSKLMEDAKERRAIMEQIDGKPHQTTDVNATVHSIMFLPTEVAGKNAIPLNETDTSTGDDSK